MQCCALARARVRSLVWTTAGLGHWPRLAALHCTALICRVWACTSLWCVTLLWLFVCGDVGWRGGWRGLFARTGTDPDLRDIAESAAGLGFRVILENKRHPRDWSVRGRARIELVTEAGEPRNPEIATSACHTPGWVASTRGRGRGTFCRSCCAAPCNLPARGFTHGARAVCVWRNAWCVSAQRTSC